MRIGKSSAESVVGAFVTPPRITRNIFPERRYGLTKYQGSALAETKLCSYTTNTTVPGVSHCWTWNWQKKGLPHCGIYKSKYKEVEEG
jgi:hypothetical protein